jgi:hypothetical protein
VCSFCYTSIEPVGAYPYSLSIDMNMHDEFLANQN